MRQRKFTSWHIVFVIASCILFASGHAMAASLTCQTAKDSLDQFIEVSAVTGGGWPLYLEDPSKDPANPVGGTLGYCGNDNSSNYPCTVFRYKTVSNGFNANHLYATIPVCPDDQLKLLKTYSTYPICNPGNNKFFDSITCNLEVIYAPDAGGSGTSTHQWYLAFYTPPGMKIGLGVNNIYLAKSGSDTTFYPCTSTNADPYRGSYPSGILGPSCYQELPQPPICDAPGPGSSGTTTNTCLPNVGGRVLKLDVQDEAIEAVYQCPTGDFSCASPTCIPSDTTSCSPSTTCVKQETYEVKMTLFDENGNEIPGGGIFGIQEVGGTVEEAIGYFVLTDGDPTIYCLSGVGGNTKCVCSGSPGNCPAQ